MVKGNSYKMKTIEIQERFYYTKPRKIKVEKIREFFSKILAPTHCDGCLNNLFKEGFPIAMISSKGSYYYFCHECYKKFKKEKK